MHVDVLADVIGLNNLSLPAVSEPGIVLVISSDSVWGEKKKKREGGNKRVSYATRNVRVQHCVESSPYYV